MLCFYFGETDIMPNRTRVSYEENKLSSKLMLNLSI